MLIMVQNSLTGNFCFMGGFYTGVFLFDLMDFAVDAGGKGITDLTDGLVRLKL